jgi:hypothetical protein
MLGLETLKAEYTLLSQEGGTEASWEEYKEDWLVVQHYHQDLYHQAKDDEWKATKCGEYRIIFWFGATINSVFTLACPLYAPVGIATQVLLFKMIKQ